MGGRAAPVTFIEGDVDMTSTNKALLEEFAERVAKAGGRLSDWTGKDDFCYVHCPFPGPEDDPHELKGAPGVYIWMHAGDPLAHCNKCLGTKDELGADCDGARKDYTDQLKELIGWQHEPAAARGHTVVRTHEYRDRDGKSIVRKKKVKLGRAGFAYWWDAAPAAGPAGYLTPWKPTKANEFLAANYPEYERMYQALHWYKLHERLALPEGEAGDPDFFEGKLRKPFFVAICEGEKDCDAFNELMSFYNWIGCGPFGTCLAYNRPKKLSAHHLPLIKGAHVTIIPDRDKAGWDQAENWARLLWDLGGRIKMICLSGLSGKPDDKDLSDWIAKRGGPSKAVATELVDIMTSAQPLSERPESTAERTSMLAFIGEWYEKRYAPHHRARSGKWVFSAAFGTRVTLQDIYYDDVIIKRLEDASDAPQYVKGGVQKRLLPAEFTKVMRAVWGRQMTTLPSEDSDAAREIAGHGEVADFRRDLVRLLGSVIEGAYEDGTTGEYHSWAPVPMANALLALCEARPRGDWVRLGGRALFGKLAADGRFLIGLLPVLGSQVRLPVNAIANLHPRMLTQMAEFAELWPDGVDVKQNRIRHGGDQVRVTLIDAAKLPELAVSHSVSQGEATGAKPATGEKSSKDNVLNLKR